MKKKKVLYLLMSFVLILCMIAGCGSSRKETSASETAAEEEAAGEEKTIEAKLISFEGQKLVIEFEGTQYTMDLADAQINATAMHAGDTILIHYQGDLPKDDASVCKVLSVEIKEDKNDRTELVGTLEDITMNSITIRVLDGRVLTFNATNAQRSFSYGVGEGNWVTVIYTGELNGTDTSNLAVIEIHDEDTAYVKEIKAQSTVEDANDTVYALESVQVRASYMMASQVVGTLKAGEPVKRTGHCNNGWDRVTFNGREAYIYGTLLTTDPNEIGNKGSLTPISQKVKIKDLSETVYVKSDANVRQGYSTASPAIGALKAGSAVLRTGICDNGWSRINYNGKIAFVYSDLLTTKNPNSEKDGVKITAVNETVYIVKDANIRKSWSEDSEAVGSLKYGEKVMRTGICDNGWSRIIYNKEDAYIRSDLISKTNPVEEKTVKIYKANGYAWAVSDANVRESFTVDSKSLGVLTKDSGIAITGVTDNGWTRVDYKGKVGYIHNDLLTSKNPKPDKPVPETETKAPETETKAPETKATETKAPETETKAPETKATETKAPETETKAPETETKAPETETKAPETETQAPETETQAPETESIETEAPETEAPVTETMETEAPETEAPLEEHDIVGVVVGYDLQSVTIRVEGDDSPASKDTRPAEEPAVDSSEEYPSISYSEAKGKETTYYTFDISKASQSYSQGINEGLVVKITYTGDLSDMSTVFATHVTDKDVDQTTKIFRGSVISATKNTVTVLCRDDVENTFDFSKAEVDAKKLVPGTNVTVIADMKGSKLEDNILKAIKIDIEKEE